MTQTQTQQERVVAALTDKLKDGTITPTEKGTLRALTGGREPTLERVEAHEAMERGAARARQEVRGGSLYDEATKDSVPDELAEWAAGRDQGDRT